MRASDIPAVFDGVSPERGKAFPLRLKSVERRESDTLWFAMSEFSDEDC